MSFISRLFAAALVLFAFVQPADAARRGGSGYAEELMFLAETGEKDTDGAAISLCILAKQRNILGFINTWKTAEAYVLAPNRCLDEKYYSMDEAQFAAAKAAGVIPADLPDTPELSLGQKLMGSWGLIAILLLILFVIFKFLGSKKRAMGRRKSFGNMSVAHSRILEVMCQAAYTDGIVHEQELSTIANIAHQLLGREFSNAELREIVDTCDKKLSDNQFKAFGKGLKPSEKADVLRAAFMVLAADGDMAKEENVFLNKLVAGLGIPADVARAVLSGQ